MSNKAISVSGLGKKYLISGERGRTHFREIISDPRKLKKTKKEEFWALKDVGFEVEKGDTLAIIGRNGAGKSTLLKILSRVVEPTEGSAEIRGRTASLLEVGTGFHPDLTGRENVYFNGALLGMTKSEIASRFKEIVAFSEIGNFLDTPIKRYSSGMKVRLAFSVAVTLDAEVMIIDEALAVGDAAFKQKSLEKMKAASFDGRTVLFVTHSMSSAQDLCNKGLYLKDGQKEMFGQVSEVVDTYLSTTRTDIGADWNSKDSSAKKGAPIVPKSLSIRNAGTSSKAKEISYGDDIEVDLEVMIKDPHSKMAIGVSLLDESSRRVFRTTHQDSDKPKKLKKGVNKLTVKIPTSYLLPGLYVLAFDADDGKTWAIKPNQTSARIGFLLKQPTEFQLWNPEREANIKPRLNWK